jgi:hypothetical protein
MYEHMITQQADTIKAMQKQLETVTQQMTAMNTLLSAFMSQSHTNTNGQDLTSVVLDDTTTTSTSTPMHEPTGKAASKKKSTTTTTLAASKATTTTTTHAVNKTADITKGTPRIANYYAPLSETTTTPQTQPASATREHDTNMDAAEAFNALLSTTTPTTTSTSTSTHVVGNKRLRTDEEEDNTPLATSTSTSTSSSTNKAARTQRGSRA